MSPTPRSIDDQIADYLVAAINASRQATTERKKGTVASRHLPGIASRLAATCDLLSMVMESYEKAHE